LLIAELIRGCRQKPQCAGDTVGAQISFHANDARRQLLDHILEAHSHDFPAQGGLPVGSYSDRVKTFLPMSTPITARSVVVRSVGFLAASLSIAACHHRLKRLGEAAFALVADRPNEGLPFKSWR